MRVLLVAAAAGLLCAGCVRTVADVVTAPVKVVSKGVDWATTSQDEADRNRGREMREADEQRGREARRAEEERRRAEREARRAEEKRLRAERAAREPSGA